MCAYTFGVRVRVSVAADRAVHVLDLGGSTTAAGAVPRVPDVSSAISAPFTGSIGDRIGQRRVLIAVSLILSAFTASYAFISDHRVLLGVVIVHGLFWSGLLTASGAYMTSTLPPSRRAEGLGYWGLASVVAVGAAPVIGFWVYSQGWTALCIEITTLNLLMAVIAWRLPDDHHGAHGRRTTSDAPVEHAPHHHIEWRVLLPDRTALISFAYAVTPASRAYADWLHISPGACSCRRWPSRCCSPDCCSAVRSIASVTAGFSCDVWSYRQSASLSGVANGRRGDRRDDLRRRIRPDASGVHRVMNHVSFARAPMAR